MLIKTELITKSPNSSLSKSAIHVSQLPKREEQGKCTHHNKSGKRTQNNSIFQHKMSSSGKILTKMMGRQWLPVFFVRISYYRQMCTCFLCLNQLLKTIVYRSSLLGLVIIDNCVPIFFVWTNYWRHIVDLSSLLGLVITDNYLSLLGLVIILQTAVYLSSFLILFLVKTFCVETLSSFASVPRLLVVTALSSFFSFFFHSVFLTSSQPHPPQREFSPHLFILRWHCGWWDAKVQEETNSSHLQTWIRPHVTEANHITLKPKC